MLTKLIKRSSALSSVIFRLGRNRAILMVDQIEEHLNRKFSILDIGTGTGNIAHELLKRGYRVQTIDVEDLCMNDNIKPKIYDGVTIPYQENKFKTSLLLSVMHHTSEPAKLLAEASRVSKEVIIIEDIYENLFTKRLTFFFDSLFNLEFKGHPHTNKTDKEWQDLFKDNNLRLKEVNYFRSFIVFNHAVYHLAKR